jgi:hypothetical protein
MKKIVAVFLQNPSYPDFVKRSPGSFPDWGKKCTEPGNHNLVFPIVLKEYKVGRLFILEVTSGERFVLFCSKGKYLRYIWRELGVLDTSFHQKNVPPPSYPELVENTFFWADQTGRIFGVTQQVS